MAGIFRLPKYNVEKNKFQDVIVLPKDRVLYTSRTGRIYFQRRTPENSKKFRARKYIIDTIKQLKNGGLIAVTFVGDQLQHLFTQSDLRHASKFMKHA